MATCRTISQPSKVRRTVVLIGAESQVVTAGVISQCPRTPGATGALRQVLLYTDFNPMQAEFDVIQLNRARNGLAPEAPAVGIGTYNFTARTYLAPSAFPNVSPNWSELLRSAGWRERRYSNTTSNAHGLSVASSFLTLLTGSGTDTNGFAYSDISGLNSAGPHTYKYALSQTKAGVKGETLLDKTDTDTSNASFDATTNKGYSLDLTKVTGVDSAAAYLNIYRTKANGLDFYKIASLSISSLTITATAPTTNTTFIDSMPDNELTELAPTEEAAASRVEWTPQNGDAIDIGDVDVMSQESTTVIAYLDSRYHFSTGTRGTWTIGPTEAGQPIEMNFNLRGTYNPSVFSANVAPLSTPEFPKRLVKTTVKLYPGTQVAYLNNTSVGSYISPVVKNVGIDAGANVTQRLDAQQDEGLLEYGIYGQYEPKISMQIEVDKSHNIDFIEAFKNQIKFDILLEFGLSATTSGTYLKVTSSGDGTTTTYSAALNAAPQYSDNNEIRTWNLDFLIAPPDTGLTNEAGFLKIVQTYNTVA